MMKFKKVISCCLAFIFIISCFLVCDVYAEQQNSKSCVLDFDNMPLGALDKNSTLFVPGSVNFSGGAKAEIVNSQDGKGLKLTVPNQTANNKKGSMGFEIPIENVGSSAYTKISYDLKLESNTVWTRKFPSVINGDGKEITSVSNGFALINLGGDPGTFIEEAKNLNNDYNKITVIINHNNSTAYAYINNEYKSRRAFTNNGSISKLGFSLSCNDTYDHGDNNTDGVYYIDNITVENCDEVKMISPSILDKSDNVDPKDVLSVTFTAPLEASAFTKNNFLLYEDGNFVEDYFVEYTPDYKQVIVARIDGWNYDKTYSLKIASMLPSKDNTYGSTSEEYNLSFKTKPLSDFCDLKLSRVNGKIKVVADIKGNVSDAEVYVGMYDENGMLLDLTDEKVDVNNKKSVVAYFDDVEKFNIKCFLWKNNSFVPICEATQRDVTDISTPTEIFVSGSVKESGDGSIERPFKTIEEARDYVNNSSDIKSAVVNIREGEYDYLNDSLTFDNNCTKKVTYRGYKDEKVVINGAYRLDTSKATTYKDNIKVIDLSNENVDLGTISYRGTDSSRNGAMWSELMINGEIMNLARYPNEADGVIKLGGMNSDATQTDGETPLAWSYSYNIKLGANNDIYNVVKNLTDCSDLFVYDWFAPKYIGVLEAVNVTSENIMNTKYKVSLKELHKEEGTVKTVNDGQPRSYYFVNALELLDVPSEYYIDRTNKKLYFIPPENSQELDIRLTQNPNNLLYVNGAKNITFKNITFSGGKGNGIYIDNKSSDVNFDNVTVRNFGTDGIHYAADVTSYNSNIERSEIFDVGEKGITMLAGDNRKLLSCNIRIYDNKIHKVGRVYSYHAAAIYEHTDYQWKNGTPGLYIGYNEIYDVNDWAICASIDTVVEYNNIHNCAKYGDDTGALYWGQNYYNRGRVLRYNYIHDIKTYNQSPTHGVHGLYLDGATGVTVIGNIFENIDNHAIFSSDGGMHIIHDNIIIGNSESNEYYKNGTGIGIEANGMYDETSEQLKAKIPEYTYSSPIWIGRYPYLAWNLRLDRPNVPSSKLYRNYVLNSNPISLTDKFYDHEFALNENNCETTMDNVTFENLKNKTVTLSGIDGFVETNYSKIGDIKSKVFEASMGSVIYCDNSDLCIKDGKIQAMTEIPEGAKAVFGDVTVVNSQKDSSFYDNDILECIRCLVDIH